MGLREAAILTSATADRQRAARTRKGAWLPVAASSYNENARTAASAVPAETERRRKTNRATLVTGNPKDFPMDGVTVEHWPVGT